MQSTYTKRLDVLRRFELILCFTFFSCFDCLFVVRSDFHPVCHRSVQGRQFDSHISQLFALYLLSADNLRFALIRQEWTGTQTIQDSEISARLRVSRFLFDAPAAA
jgi:hypothetical protein